MSPIDHVQEGGSWNATCTINVIRCVLYECFKDYLHSNTSLSSFCQGFPYTTVQWITPNHQMIQSIKASRSKRFSVNENGTLHVEGFEKSDQGTYRYYMYSGLMTWCGMPAPRARQSYCTPYHHTDW